MMCDIERMTHDLSNPHGWEAMRRAMSPQEVLRLLADRSDPLSRARFVEVLATTGGTPELLQARELLPFVDERFRAALTVVVQARLGSWREAQITARAYVQPPGLDPLALEAGCLLGHFGTLVERELREHRMAERMLGMGLALASALGLPAKCQALHAEALRGATLMGSGDPGALRQLLAQPCLSDMQRAANTKSLAESLGSYGEYQEALAVVSAGQDARSRGMTAFYSAVLGLNWVDDGGSDDWMRLARAVASYEAGEFAIDGLADCAHEPQATYAHLLMGAAVLRGQQPVQAALTLGHEPPAPHDQRALWAAGRLSILAAGGEVEGTALLLEVWRSALKGLRHIGPLVRLLATQTPETLWLLAHLPDAPPELVVWREQASVLRGRELTVGRQSMRAAGRAGELLIAEAAGLMLKGAPLRGNEAKRLEERYQDLQLTTTPLNTGRSLRVALALRGAARATGTKSPDAEGLPDLIIGGLTPGMRLLLYSAMKEVAS